MNAVKLETEIREHLKDYKTKKISADNALLRISDSLAKHTPRGRELEPGFVSDQNAFLVHRIKRIKYDAARTGSGFYGKCKNPRAIGNLVDMLAILGKARELESLIGYEIPIKEVNWHQAAMKVFRARRK